MADYVDLSQTHAEVLSIDDSESDPLALSQVHAEVLTLDDSTSDPLSLSQVHAEVLTFYTTNYYLWLPDNYASVKVRVNAVGDPYYLNIG